MRRRRSLVTFTLSLEQVGYILGIGFILGVLISAALAVHLTGIKIRAPYRPPCPERYK